MTNKIKRKNKTQKRKTRKMKGGMIEFSEHTQKWIAGPNTEGIVNEYSNAEASFLNKLGVGNVENQWVFNPENAVPYFNHLDPTQLLHDATVSKEDFENVYLKMQSVLSSLNRAHTTRDLNDDDISRLPDHIRSQFTTDHDQFTHRQRTNALKDILTRLKEIFHPYEIRKQTEFTTVVTPKPLKKPTPTVYSTFRHVPEDIEEYEDTAEAAEDFGAAEESVKPLKRSPKQDETSFDFDSLNPENNCQCCGKKETTKKFNVCARCRKVKYCSMECQKTCWPEHKPHCNPYVTTTLPFFLEGVKSLHFSNPEKFNCYVVTKTQLLVLVESRNIYAGPFVVTSNGETTPQLKEDKYNILLHQLLAKFKRLGPGFKDEFEERMIQLLRKFNPEEPKPTYSESEAADILTTVKPLSQLSNRILKQRELIYVSTARLVESNHYLTALTQLLHGLGNTFINDKLSELGERVEFTKIKELIDEALTIKPDKDLESGLREFNKHESLVAELEKETINLELFQSKFDRYTEAQREKIKDYNNLNELGLPHHPITDFCIVNRNIAVSMNDCIYVLSSKLKIGTTKGYSSGTNVECKMNNPTEFIVDSKRNIVVILDTGNNCIRHYQLNGVMKSFMGHKPGYENGSEIVKWKMNSPMGITIDEDGNYILADTGNDCIRKMSFNKGTHKIITIAGRQPGEAMSTLNKPMGVCMLGSDIIVADTGNHCIRKLTRTPDGYKMDIIAGTPGEAGYRNGYSSLFHSPSKVQIWKGNIYVADTGNNRIRVIINHIPTPDEFPKGLIL